MVYEIQTIIRLMIETWMIVLWMIVSMALCLETPAPPLETQWCCASKPQVRRASKPLGDKF